MALRALLIDLDDTLHDKAASTAIVAERQYGWAQLKARGVQKDHWIATYVALNDLRIEKTEVFMRVGRQFELEPELVARMLTDFDTNFSSYVVPMLGATELLVGAKAAGLKVGIVTNGRDEFQRRKIEGLGLLAHTDCVVTSGGFGRKKPDPAIFHECLRILNVGTTESVFVGDDLHADVEPAAELGMRAVWKSQQSSPHAVFCSPSLHEIYHFVLANA
jgi:putative hydrolase of the HAD superfamily